MTPSVTPMLSFVYFLCQLVWPKKYLEDINLPPLFISYGCYSTSTPHRWWFPVYTPRQSHKFSSGWSSPSVPSRNPPPLWSRLVTSYLHTRLSHPPSPTPFSPSSVSLLVYGSGTPSPRSPKTFRSHRSHLTRTPPYRPPPIPAQSAPGTSPH